MSDQWRAEFLRLMVNPEGTIEDIQQAFRLKNENLPRTLYRYRPPEEYSIQELEHDSVFFSTPSGQNDPFDSIFTISMSEIIKALSRVNFIQIAQKSGVAGHLTAEQAQLCAQSEDPTEALYATLISSADPSEKAELTKLCGFLREFSRRESEKTAGLMQQLAQQHLRICCFTPDYQSSSMWDRYSRGHKGLCIAYDFSLLPSDELRRRWVYPVIYSDTPFDLTTQIIASIERNVIAPLWPMLASIHKSSDWSNEREWRLVMPPEVDPTPKLERLIKPSAVYIGAQMEPDLQQRAEEIARRRAIPIFKMEVSHRDRRMIAITR